MTEQRPGEGDPAPAYDFPPPTPYPTPPPVYQPPVHQPPVQDPGAPPPYSVAPVPPWQQPYPAYGYPVPPPPPPTPRWVGGYATAAIVSAALVLADQLLQVVVGWPSGTQTADARDLGFQAEPNGWYVTMGVHFVLLAVAYVCGARWLWHARSNAAAMSPATRFTLDRGWAWGAWVTPVVALWFPFQVVRDTLRATSPDSEQIALGWFPLWLLWVITDYWVPVLVADTGGNAIRLLGLWEVVSFALCALAFGRWVQVIRRVSRAQAEWWWAGAHS